MQSRLARVVLADANPRALGALAQGFQREGVAVLETAQSDEVLRYLLEAEHPPDLVVAAVNLEGEDGLALTQRIRHEASVRKLPLVLLGDPDKRAAATAAGASDFVGKPALVRDVVTLSRLLTMGKDAPVPTWSGQLARLHGLGPVIGALAAAQRTGILFLMRPDRHGELRFHQGEIMSAQAGALSGVAALHTLLLWDEAEFELRAEPVANKPQVPLATSELLEDANRFLSDFHALAGEMTPASIYEQDFRRVAECVDRIPKEVSGVVRLFDGRRTMADVVQDSAFRVFETLKIARRLLELGAIRRLALPQTTAGSGLAHSVEDWLVATPMPAPPAPPPAQAARRSAAEAIDWDALAAQAPTLLEEPSHSGEHAAVVAGEIEGRPLNTGAIERALAETSLPNIAVGALLAELEAQPEPAAAPVTDEEHVHEGLLSGPTRETLEGVLNKERDEERDLRIAGGPAEPLPQAPHQPREPVPAPAPPVAARRPSVPHFDEMEEQFFRDEHKFHAPHHPVESFADLDEGRPQPTSFWKRLFRGKSPAPAGKGPQRPAPATRKPPTRR